tara:strand:+ start:481 stop:843 length:363 start_codon:yes stop_codon:yes gene_type:complete
MYKLSTEEKGTFQIQPQTALGAPATIDGAMKVELISGDAELLEGIEVLADGLSCTIRGGIEGEGVLLVTADADLGEDVKELSIEIPFMVTAPMAASLQATFTAPEIDGVVFTAPVAKDAA